MHLFTPATAPRGIVLLAPGGGQDHLSPGVVARAARLTERGYVVPVVRSIDAVPAVLAGHPGPVGFWGLSHGTRVGLPLLAAEPRIGAAVLGLADGPMASAPLVTAPVLFYVQSDDEMVRPDACRALFDALGSTDRTLVENPGGHLDLPPTTVEESVTWLDGKLSGQGSPAAWQAPAMESRDEELPLWLEVQRTEEELHMYDGLVRVMRDPHAMLDAVLEVDDPDAAQAALRERFDLDDLQARVALDLQFRRATLRDRRRIEERNRELADRLAYLRKKQAAGAP
jgi:dienelactone hydrolase